MPLPKVWPVAANAAESMIEEYGYLTDVFRAISGMEQRVQLRRHPVGSLEASYLCDVAEDSQAAAAIIHGNQDDKWLVPLWMYAQRLQTALNIGDTDVAVPTTTDIPFQDASGFGAVGVLWSGPRSSEAFYIQTVNPTSLTLPIGVTKAWGTAGTFVLPARVGRLAEIVSYRWITGKVMEARLIFEFEPPDDILDVLTWAGIGGAMIPVEGG